MGKVNITSNKTAKRILMRGWLSWFLVLVSIVPTEAVLGYSVFGAGIVAMIDLVFGNHITPLYDYSLIFGIAVYVLPTLFNGCILLTMEFQRNKKLNRWLIILSSTDFVCTICHVIIANLLRPQVIETAFCPLWPTQPPLHL